MGRLILDTDLALHNREEARFPLPYTNKSLAIHYPPCLFRIFGGRIIIDLKEFLFFISFHPVKISNKPTTIIKNPMNAFNDNISRKIK